MQQELIAPCGMNCQLCISYQAKENDINKQGFHRKYCPGCIPRGKNCLHMADSCQRVGKGLVRFCFECQDFPCQRLKSLDKRYRTKYHLSMIDNLEAIKKQGMAGFLADQAIKWRCSACGGVICCHSGLCLKCNLDKLRQTKTYRWTDEVSK